MSGNKLLTAQDVMGNYEGGSAYAGFNRRIQGWTYPQCFAHPNEQIDNRLHAGWDLADKMIEEGRLFYVHNFHKSHGGCPNGYAFPYGGTWACNVCNRDHLDQPWWKIKVMKDGNAWCCIGTEFENLQESKTYAFGDTPEAAIQAYGDLMAKTNLVSAA